MRPLLLWLVSSYLLVIGPLRADDPPPSKDDEHFFAEKVLPLLETRCLSCHSEDNAKGGLRLDSRAALLAGGDSGPAAEPGSPDESFLIEAIRYDSQPAMPPKSKLPDGEIAILVDWVARGLPWSAVEGDDPEPVAPAKSDFDLAARAKHWSFQRVAPVEPPEVSDPSWPLDALDRFILHRLDAEGLRPAPEADRRVWLRRVTFDLTGLPPTPSELAAFLADESPVAREKVVDRLLASPHYGERWGRHWLDLVRYAETSGHEFDYDIPHAWRYRDYVVGSLNDDLPYNRFVTEQIAGDLLPDPRRDPATGRNESVLGTGFYFLGEGTHSPVDLLEDRTSRVDNQIDVLSKTFLGLTVACARCHDHKFDPISAADYYALAGFLRSSRHQQAFLDPPATLDEPAGRLADIRQQVADLLAPAPQSSPNVPDLPGTTPFASFDGPTFAPWTATGQAFGTGPSGPQELRINERSLTVVPAGLAHSGLDASRLQGVLRSPTFTIEQPYIWTLASGAGGRINLVVEGFEKIRSPIYGGLTLGVDSPDEFRWYVQDVSMWVGHRAYIELADGSFTDYQGANSVLVPGTGFLAIEEIRFASHADPGPPPDRCPVVLTLADCGPSASLLLDEHQAIASSLPPPSLGLAIADGTGENAPIQIRGGTRNLGPVVPRRFLEALGGEPTTPEDGGSGRLDLARRIADPANPLTARVIVNRLWHHHFGAGLVASPDDFGLMGQPPTHPELLDWLAATFIADGWSLKAMHRRMVLSRTYRQASVGDPASEAADPTNRFLHRANLRRLEAEPLRDALLALSGRLDSTLGGPSVAPHLTPFMEGRGRPGSSGPLDGDRRRTIYLNVRRNFLSPFLQAFDYPTPATCIGRRNISNVPGQALSLLNDPFVLQQARLWAERVLEEADGLDPTIDLLHLQAFGRPPTEHERSLAHDFLGDEPDAEELAAYCHVLLNMKEFLFLP